MRISGINALDYAVEDLDQAVRFYRDWGLDLQSNDASGAEFTLADGATIRLRRADDPDLPPALINWAHLGGSTVREVTWGVDSATGLDAIGAELSKDRAVTSKSDGSLHTTDDLGFHIAFRVGVRGKPKTDLPDTNSVDNAARRNIPAEGATRMNVKPLRMGHIVFWTPDFKSAASFYAGRLGFRITDNVTGGGIFLRCAGTNDHHNLLLQSGGDYLGFQHVAFEFRDFDAVMLHGAHMEKNGWRTNVGPLRHNIGSSISWYIWNPAGGLAEAYCDMDYADDDWVVRDFNPEDPSFYGHSWNARPEQAGRRPADLHDD